MFYSRVREGSYRHNTVVSESVENRSFVVEVDDVNEGVANVDARATFRERIANLKIIELRSRGPLVF